MIGYKVRKCTFWTIITIIITITTIITTIITIKIQNFDDDDDDGDDDDDDGDDDAIALQYNDRIQIRSILCVFSTDEPCKDRLILTAKKTDKKN